MSVKTEPAIAGFTLATLVALATPVLKSIGVDPHAVSTIGYAGAVGILTIGVFVRQFVTPTSKLGKDLAIVESVVHVLEPAAQPQPLAPPTVVDVPAPPAS